MAHRLLLLIGLSAILLTPADAAQGQGRAGNAADNALALSVSLNEVDDAELRGRLRAAVTLFGDAAADATTLAAVRRFADEDAQRLTQVLHAEGYYAGEAQPIVSRTPNGARVTYQVETGPRFMVTRHRLVYTDADNTSSDDGAPPRPDTPEALGVTTTPSARGEALTQIERAVLATLRRDGFPLTRRLERYVEANFSTATAEAVLVLETGPRARFGPVRWTGLERTDPAFLERAIPWEPGAPFNIEELRAYRDRLGAMNLFKVLQLEPGAPDAEGLAPVLADVRERRPRTVGGGVSYSTNLGPGANAFWEHRNLFGAAERLRLASIVAANEQSLEALGRKPYPASRLEAFAGAEFAREDNDAFIADSLTANVGVEKKLRRHWSVRVAGEVEAADSEDAFGETRTTLFATPLRVAWDTVDDPLDPTRGSRVAADLTPVTGNPPSGLTFLLTETTLVRHQPLRRDRRVILAGWSRIGLTTGADLADIPATRRFYAGGGGSVRAYGYQRLGPLLDDTPTGGRSVLAGGFELRARLGGPWSLASFVEGGVVSERETPDFTTRDGLAGAGLGVRYATPIGPVRLDIAAPFDRRDDADAPVQVYISLGQAF